MIVFACSACNQKLKVADKLSGKRVKCPRCGQQAGIAPKPAAPLPETAPDSLPEDPAEMPTLPPSPRDAPTAGDSPSTEALLGTAIESSVPGYDLLSELGRGGMGVVYKAFHQRLKRPVALKMILGGAHVGAAEITRFRTEAEAVARIQHPNIVQIFEVGDHAGLPYFSLEFVDGGSLAGKLGGQPLSPRAAARLVELLAEAMHAAHERGIIHRDLKPANVLLARADAKHGVLLGDGEADQGHFQPKITDFGLAKQLDADSGQTRSGAIMGTPSYMAPEQAEGKGQIGPAADVYALGAILYELLTGRPPFRADTPLNTVLQVVADDPVPPSRLQSRVPRDLETICLKCLQKDPKRRYASAEALAEDLRRYLAGEPIKARPTGNLERTLMWVRRRPAVAGLLAATITLFLVGFALTAWQWQRAEDQREQAVYNAAQAQEAQAAAEKAQATAEINADKEHKARVEADAERLKAQRLLTALALDQSQAASSQGDVSGGLLWLVRSLDNMPKDQPGLERYARTSLAAWAAELPPLAAPVLQHDSPVTLAIFSPDGRTILTGSDNGAVGLWDATSGKRIGLGMHARGKVLYAAFSRNGERAVTGSSNDGVARIWDTKSGRFAGVPLEPPGSYGAVAAVAFSPDGASVVTGYFSTGLQRWDAATGKRIGQMMPHGVGVKAVAYSPDGKTILSTDGTPTVRLWNAATGELVGEPLKHKEQVFVAAYSPDGKRIATASADKVQLWDTATGKQVGGPWQHNNRVSALAFRFDSMLLATSAVQEVRLWDVRTGQAVEPKLPFQPDRILSVAFSPDGKTILTVHDKFARFWDIQTGKPANAPLLHPMGLATGVFSPDGQSVLTGGKDMTARLWQFRRRQPFFHTSDHPGDVFAPAFTQDSRTLAIATKIDSTILKVQVGQLRVIDLTTGRLARPPLEFKHLVACFALSPDGKTIAVGNFDNTLRLWDLKLGEQIGQPLAPLQASSCAFSPDGRLLATGDAFGAALWDVQTHQRVGELLRIDKHTGIFRVAFSPDGKLLATGGTNGARLWITATRQSPGPSMEHRGQVRALSFSPDGSSLLTASDDGMARVWDTATCQPRSAPMYHRASIRTAVFSPDGRSVLTASDDGSARLWDAATGQPKGTPLLHPASQSPAPVFAAAFSPDGRMIVTSGVDFAARLWDAATCRPLGPPLLHDSSYVEIAAFAPDGNSFMAATVSHGFNSMPSTVRTWKTPSPLDAEPERIRLWVEVLTGTELKEDGASRILDSAEWHQRRQQLEELGGPPLR